MKSRKTVTIPIGASPEKNKFSEAKINKFVPKKNTYKTCQKTAIDFEQFLWDNAAAEFYSSLREAMNNRYR